MTPCPFSLPLTAPEFASALHKGQGRALMHARSAGLAGCEAVLLDACLHNRAYDPQCEGDRIPWLLNMIDAGGLAPRLLDALVYPQAPLSDDHWDVGLRSGFLRELARRGSSEARRVLYALLGKRPDSNDVMGAEDIVELDGAAGLLHVAEFLGSLLETVPGFWVDEYLLQLFDESRAEGEARRVLEAGATAAPMIGVFLRAVDQSVERRRLQSASAGPRSAIEDIRSRSGEQVIRIIESDDPRFPSFYAGHLWGRGASPTELGEVFESMTRQSDPARLRKYLRVFRRAALPAFDARLIPYVHHDDPEVRSGGYDAISNYAHPEVRRLGLERLTQGRVFEGELQLLRMNFRPGDGPVVFGALRILADRDEQHRLDRDLLDVITANPCAELAPAAVFAYEHSPCSHCRWDAVKSLLATGTAPTWLLDECQCDASEEIRTLVGAPSGG